MLETNLRNELSLYKVIAIIIGVILLSTAVNSSWKYKWIGIVVGFLLIVIPYYSLKLEQDSEDTEMNLLNQLNKK
jgi:hypothetical protein